MLEVNKDTLENDYHILTGIFTVFTLALTSQWMESEKNQTY